MKRSIYSFAGLIILLCLGLTSYAKTNFAGSTCFTDAFGYVWKLNYTGDQSGSVTTTGTVDIGGGSVWNVWGSAWGRNGSGSVELHAINPSPDGCFYYTDSFVYVGTATIDRSTGHYTDFGSGTWNCYCYGGVLNSGTWSATGPCGSSSITTNPNGPAVHSGVNFGKSCFVDGFGYLWEFHYWVTSDHVYSIQGQVNIGSGTNWKVWGTATLQNSTGPVQLHAINPNPDGCTQYTDSFTYWGSTSILRSEGSYTFDASGTWDSYCFGGVLNEGTWATTGPCSKVSGLQKVNPNGPATAHATQFRFTVSPNPLRSSSNISYTLTKNSRVTLTVYNYMQQPVKVLIDKNETTGKHSYTFDGRSSSGATLPNGVYRVVAVVNGKSYTSGLQIMR